MAMTSAQKLAFVHKMTHLALSNVQHFDEGGSVAPRTPSVYGSNNPAPVPSTPAGPALSGPVLAGTGNAVPPGGLASGLGVDNKFQASPAVIQPGTNVGQLNTAYQGAQNALGASTNLTNTLAPGVNQGATSQALLTEQLRERAAGGGPNPAQSALNQNTSNNIKQAAALAASVRGAGSNPGLVSTNAANTAAATNQQAVGQEATLEAQQQIAAQDQLQGLAGAQVGQGTNAVQLQNQTAQNEQNILEGANTAANNAAVSQQQNINTTNANVATGNAAANSNIVSGIGGALAGIGTAALLFNEGGEVPDHYRHIIDIYHPHLSGGGMVWQDSTPAPTAISGGESMNPSQAANPLGGVNNAIQSAVGVLAKRYESDAQGGTVGSKLKRGGSVPGQPQIPHNDPKNDTVDAKLSPGEVVIDIDTLKRKDKVGKMARFVAANIERKKAGRKLA